MSDIFESPAFQEFLQKRGEEYAYAKNQLINSGIGFNKIPLENILATCSKYSGIITKRNYVAVVEAVKNIYDNLSEAKGN
jgi:hypothetical protein